MIFEGLQFVFADDAVKINKINFPDNYLRKCVKEYDINENELKKLILDIIDMPNNFLEIKLNSLLYKLRKEFENA